MILLFTVTILRVKKIFINARSLLMRNRVKCVILLCYIYTCICCLQCYVSNNIPYSIQTATHAHCFPKKNSFDQMPLHHCDAV